MNPKDHNVSDTDTPTMPLDVIAPAAGGSGESEPPNEPLSGTDFSEFTVDDDEAGPMAGETVLMRVPIGRPGNQATFCVSPDPAHRRTLRCYVEKGEGISNKTYYLISPGVAQLVPESCGPVLLVLCVTPEGTPRLWPLSMKRDKSGNLNDWAESAYDIVTDHAGKWIRVSPVPGESGYQPTMMKAPTKPRWPGMTFDEILEIAFKRRTIKDPDHPIIRHQLGKE